MKEQIIEIKKETHGITNVANVIQVRNQEENETAVGYLKVIKGLKKKVDEAFDPIIQANHKAWKTSIGQKKKHYDPLLEAEKKVKDKMREFLRKEEEKTREIQKKLEKEAKKHKVEAPKIEPQKTQGQVRREKWYAVVENKAKIPLDYLQPDMPKLHAMARAKKGESDIPGVTFKKDIVVGIR